jgi:hypothetical protein
MLLRYVTVTQALTVVVMDVCFYLTCMKGKISDFRHQKPHACLSNQNVQGITVGKY